MNLSLRKMLRFLNSALRCTKTRDLASVMRKNFATDAEKEVLKEHMQKLEALKKLIDSGKIGGDPVKLKKSSDIIGQRIQEIKTELEKPGGEQ